jgi:hypothetical protein
VATVAKRVFVTNVKTGQSGWLERGDDVPEWASAYLTNPKAVEGELPDEGQDPEEGLMLEGLTVAQLQEYAAEHEIDLDGASRKDDIISAIRQAEAE